MCARRRSAWRATTRGGARGSSGAARRCAGAARLRRKTYSRSSAQRSSPAAVDSLRRLRRTGRTRRGSPGWPRQGLRFPDQLGDDGLERLGLQGVDPALARASGDRESGAFESLQVLGRLRLTKTHEVGHDADRTRPLGEQPDDLPPGAVGQCRPCGVHDQKYSLLRIFLSRNMTIFWTPSCLALAVL